MCGTRSLISPSLPITSTRRPRAMSSYQRALQLLELDDAPDEVQRCRLLLALGMAQRAAGDIVSARPTFERTATLARSLGLWEHLARAALGLGGTWGEGDAHPTDDLLVQLLEEAAAKLDEHAGALKAMGLSRLAFE